MSRIIAAAFGLFAAVSAASAEQRTFVITNQPGEYGIDQCLSTGARCGTLVADAFCHSKDYAKARAFRPADPAEVTGALKPVSTGTAGQLIAIECER